MTKHNKVHARRHHSNKQANTASSEKNLFIQLPVSVDVPSEEELETQDTTTLDAHVVLAEEPNIGESIDSNELIDGDIIEVDETDAVFDDIDSLDIADIDADEVVEALTVETSIESEPSEQHHDELVEEKELDDSDAADEEKSADDDVDSESDQIELVSETIELDDELDTSDDDDEEEEEEEEASEDGDDFQAYLALTNSASIDDDPENELDELDDEEDEENDGGKEFEPELELEDEDEHYREADEQENEESIESDEDEDELDENTPIAEYELVSAVTPFSDVKIRTIEPFADALETDTFVDAVYDISDETDAAAEDVPVAADVDAERESDTVGAVESIVSEEEDVLATESEQEPETLDEESGDATAEQEPNEDETQKPPALLIVPPVPTIPKIVIQKKGDDGKYHAPDEDEFEESDICEDADIYDDADLSFADETAKEQEEYVPHHNLTITLPVTPNADNVASEGDEPAIADAASDAFANADLKLQVQSITESVKVPTHYDTSEPAVQPKATKRKRGGQAVGRLLEGAFTFAMVFAFVLIPYIMVQAFAPHILVEIAANGMLWVYIPYIIIMALIALRVAALFGSTVWNELVNLFKKN